MNNYLSTKGLHHPIARYGLRQGVGPFNGYEPFEPGEISLLSPVVDLDGKIWSLQFISPHGKKRFYPGGKLKGHFFSLGLIEKPTKILIAEGVATALTLYEDMGFPVIASFNCGNLAPVAELVRWKFPDADIVICADDDYLTEGNPGCTKAAEAATRCGGSWIPPDFDGLPRGVKDTDFNDLRRLREACHE